MIGNDAILEIKCPYIAKDTNDVIEAVNNKLVNYFLLNIRIICNILITYSSNFKFVLNYKIYLIVV